MPVRALIAALMLLLSSRAEAESLALRTPWHAVVTPPRAGLPTVTIDFGYPGPYVPTLSAPITMRATAAGVPFDGYIGYHFAVRDRQTLDTPVIARARLRPHQLWLFTTTATLKKCCAQYTAVPREIAVEWRDSAMHLLESRSAGVPPWTSWDDDLRPLRVIASNADLTSPEVLGIKPYLQRPEALPDRAQWYAGFSAVVIPLATWLDLPKTIREAIFGSGVYVVFFGLPRSDQQMGPLDQALLPVVFSARPGSYDAPWPYRESPIGTPLSWVAKVGADRIGSDQNPYIARTNAAAWSADEAGVLRPLPAMARIGDRRPITIDSLQRETGWPDESQRYLLSKVSKGQFLSVYSGATTTVLAILVATAAWMLLRRTPRAAVAVSLVLTVTVLFAQRSRIRPPSGVRHHIIRMPIAPGIVDDFHMWRAYGTAPLAEAVHDERSVRTSLTGDYGKMEVAEVRTSDTPPSMGLLHHRGDWDAASRWSYRRELDSSATSDGNRSVAIRVVADYHTPIRFWLVNRQSGPFRMEGRLRPQSDGRATCAFAFPADVQEGRTAEVQLPDPFAGRDVEIAWSTGSIKLKLVKTSIYRNPSAAISRDVCREIAAQGGIATVTVAGPVEPRDARAWIEVRENES